MANVRECKLCHRMVDFDEAWCDHETMEESAWLDIKARREADIAALRDPNSRAYQESVIDPAVHAAAMELGLKAAESFKEMMARVYDSEGRAWDAEQHRSDMDHVYQHRSLK